MDALTTSTLKMMKHLRSVGLAIRVLPPLLLLLLAPAFLSSPVQPGGEIGEFHIRSLVSAFGVHLPTCWPTIPPLACSSVDPRHHPH